jgi:hypothetical protein
MFEEFEELKTANENSEKAGNEWLEMAKDYRKSVQKLHMIFEKEELEEVETLIESLIYIACYRCTKEQYKNREKNTLNMVE